MNKQTVPLRTSYFEHSYRSSARNIMSGRNRGTNEGKIGRGRNVTLDEQQQRRRLAKPTISLESFAQRRGHVRALNEFRKRKQQKRMTTAKALRGYRKAMKREGYQAGKGAARKRWQDDGDGDGDDEEQQQQQQQQQGEAEIAEQQNENDNSDVDDDKSNVEPQKIKAEKRSWNESDDGKNEDNAGTHDDFDGDKNQELTKAGVSGDDGNRHKRKKTNPFQKSIQRAEEYKLKSERRREQREQDAKDRNKLLMKRKKKHKLLTQRTKKGQPIMKHMVNDLLEKLQKRIPNQEDGSNDNRRRIK